MTTDSRGKLASVAVLACVLLGAGAAAGQTFSEDLSVLEVEVPVQVLVDGRAVRGLTRDNFELRVDGELQKLSWFEAIEIDASRSAPATGGRAAPPAPASPPGATAGWRRHYLLLFDFAFSSRYRVRSAVEGVRRMVETQSHPSDRLAIALFAEAVGARILVPFTADRDAIELGLELLETLTDARSKRTIEKLEALDAWWAASTEQGSLPRPLLADLGSRRSTLIQPLARAPEPAGVGLPIAYPEGHRKAPSEKYRRERLDSILAAAGDSLSSVRALARSMAALVTLLRDVPEPKRLLFLSQGLGAGLFDGDATRTPVLHRLKPMLDACGDTGWILDAIDIGGIPPPPTSVLTGPEDFDTSVEVGLGVPTTAGSDNAGLFYLANETGGELFENYNRIDKATGKLLARTEASYLLAFQPRGLAPDGERYDIEVRLAPKIPGARILHRPSFRAPRPATERQLPERRMDAADLVLAGRPLDELEASVLAVVLPVAEPGSGGGRVPVFVTVGTEGLDAGRKGRKKVRLDVHGYALDATGTVRAGFARELKLRLDGEREIVLADEISLPSGAHELRVLLWDLRGRRRYLSATPLDVPATAPQGPSLRGPFFLGADPGRRPLTPKAIEPHDALALFELDGGLPAFDAAPRVARGRGRRFLLLAPGLIGNGEPRLRLVAADGSSRDRSIAVSRLPDGGGGTARFVGVLETERLEPGPYRLEASLETAIASIEVTVVGAE